MSYRVVPTKLRSTSVTPELTGRYLLMLTLFKSSFSPYLNGPRGLLKEISTSSEISSVDFLRFYSFANGTHF